LTTFGIPQSAKYPFPSLARFKRKVDRHLKDEMGYTGFFLLLGELDSLAHQVQLQVPVVVTGQLADTHKRADCQLADWTTRGLDDSRTGHLAD